VHLQLELLLLQLLQLLLLLLHLLQHLLLELLAPVQLRTLKQVPKGQRQYGCYRLCQDVLRGSLRSGLYCLRRTGTE